MTGRAMIPNDVGTIALLLMLNKEAIFRKESRGQFVCVSPPTGSPRAILRDVPTIPYRGRCFEMFVITKPGQLHVSPAGLVMVLLA